MSTRETHLNKKKNGELHYECSKRICIHYTHFGFVKWTHYFFYIISYFSFIKYDCGVYCGVQ